MPVPPIGRLQRHIKRFRKKFASKAAILMYHRVTEQVVDPWSMCVTPQYFAEQQEVLQKEFNPIGLRQLVQVHKEGKIPERAVAVTFDDGYADNLYNAKPLLEQYNIPVTVFVTTGHVGNDREFWWDELERILLQPGKLPEILTFDIKGKTFEWNLNETANYKDDNCKRDINGNINYHDNYNLYRSLHFTIHKLLQPLTEVEQYKVIDRMLKWAGYEPLKRSTYSTLSREELITLSHGEMVEIGAHTMTHPFFRTLPVSIQKDEVLQSKAILEKMTGKQVASFAYPYGNYTMETVKIVRNAGFDCACSTINDSVWCGSDLFQLPRVTVKNWNGNEFKQRLLKWIKC